MSACSFNCHTTVIIRATIQAYIQNQLMTAVWQSKVLALIQFSIKPHAALHKHCCSKSVHYLGAWAVLHMHTV